VEPSRCLMAVESWLELSGVSQHRSIRITTSPSIGPLFDRLQRLSARMWQLQTDTAWKWSRRWTRGWFRWGLGCIRCPWKSTTDHCETARCAFYQIVCSPSFTHAGLSHQRRSSCRRRMSWRGCNVGRRSLPVRCEMEFEDLSFASVLVAYGQWEQWLTASYEPRSGRELASRQLRARWRIVRGSGRRGCLWLEHLSKAVTAAPAAGLAVILDIIYLPGLRVVVAGSWELKGRQGWRDASGLSH